MNIKALEEADKEIKKLRTEIRKKILELKTLKEEKDEAVKALARFADVSKTEAKQIIITYRDC